MPGFTACSPSPPSCFSAWSQARHPDAFIFWQLLSWLLSFLSYNYSHPPAVRGAFRTFTHAAARRYCFSLRIVLVYSLYGTWISSSFLFAPPKFTLSFPSGLVGD